MTRHSRCFVNRSRKRSRILGGFLKAQGIDYLDLLPLMRSYADLTPRPSLNPDKDLYWQHNSHWSIRGEHLVGLQPTPDDWKTHRSRLSIFVIHEAPT